MNFNVSKDLFSQFENKQQTFKNISQTQYRNIQSRVHSIRKTSDRILLRKPITKIETSYSVNKQQTLSKIQKGLRNSGNSLDQDQKETTISDQNQSQNILRISQQLKGARDNYLDQKISYQNENQLKKLIIQTVNETQDNSAKDRVKQEIKPMKIYCLQRQVLQLYENLFVFYEYKSPKYLKQNQSIIDIIAMKIIHSLPQKIPKGIQTIITHLYELNDQKSLEKFPQIDQKTNLVLEPLDEFFKLFSNEYLKVECQRQLKSITPGKSQPIEKMKFMPPDLQYVSISKTYQQKPQPQSQKYPLAKSQSSSNSDNPQNSDIVQSPDGDTRQNIIQEKSIATLQQNSDLNHLAKFKMTIAYLNEKDILIEVPLDKDKYFLTIHNTNFEQSCEQCASQNQSLMNLAPNLTMNGTQGVKTMGSLIEKTGQTGDRLNESLKKEGTIGKIKLNQICQFKYGHLTYQRQLFESFGGKKLKKLLFQKFYIWKNHFPLSGIYSEIKPIFVSAQKDIFNQKRAKICDKVDHEFFKQDEQHRIEIIYKKLAQSTFEGQLKVQLKNKEIQQKSQNSSFRSDFNNEQLSNTNSQDSLENPQNSQKESYPNLINQTNIISIFSQKQELPMSLRRNTSLNNYQWKNKKYLKEKEYYGIQYNLENIKVLEENKRDKEYPGVLIPIIRDDCKDYQMVNGCVKAPFRFCRFAQNPYDY